MADFTRLERKHTHHRPAAVHNERVYTRTAASACRRVNRAKVSADLRADYALIRSIPLNSHLNIARSQSITAPELSITPAEPRRAATVMTRKIVYIARNYHIISGVLSCAERFI